MKMQVIITSVHHYDMEGNKGVAAHVVGDYEHTNNKFGLSIPQAAVPDTNELAYLAQHALDLPAKFSAEVSMGSKKSGNGKEVAVINLKNLEFLNSVEWADKKVTVKA